ncbi:MAG: nucleoside 2-deoxyribosyltransferase domain-containing protein [Promethearchaeota archaeon]|jgi:hypothetical protein
MYDVYLGGVTSPDWRKEFTSQVSSDISVFDPYIQKFGDYNAQDKAEQIAREFYFMDQSHVLVFYFNEKSGKSARLQLGDAVGRGKQVIVCLDGKVPGKTFIKRYCEYRGILLVESLEDLVTTVEECSAELELCKFDDDDV